MRELTCDLEVSPPAGDVPRAVAGPAPVQPTVRLLLALLGPQEEQAVVREQDPALPTLLRLVRPPAQLSAGLSSLSYITARAATSQKSAFTAFRQIFLISKELFIVRFLPFPFLIFLGDSEEVDWPVGPGVVPGSSHQLPVLQPLHAGLGVPRHLAVESDRLVPRHDDVQWVLHYLRRRYANWKQELLFF